MPTTRYPSRSARMVIALIAGLRPGTSPPPVRIAIVLLFAMTEKLAHICRRLYERTSLRGNRNGRRRRSARVPGRSPRHERPGRWTLAAQHFAPETAAEAADGFLLLRGPYERPGDDRRLLFLPRRLVGGDDRGGL